MAGNWGDSHHERYLWLRENATLIKIAGQDWHSSLDEPTELDAMVDACLGRVAGFISSDEGTKAYIKALGRARRPDEQAGAWVDLWGAKVPTYPAEGVPVLAIASGAARATLMVWMDHRWWCMDTGAVTPVVTHWQPAPLMPDGRAMA